MNLRKIIPTAIGALALCVLLPMAPQPGEAAEVTSIEAIKESLPNFSVKKSTIS